MREQYWAMYSKIQYQSYYYKHFQTLFNRINWCISVFCSITTLSSIAAWGIWKTYPLIWSLLICASQLIQAIFPTLPYNDLLTSTHFMICAIDKLMLDINHDWLKIELFEYSDEKILELLEKYENSYSDLTSQFFSGKYLPDIKYCERKAETECATYFYLKYNVGKEILNHD